MEKLIGDGETNETKNLTTDKLFRLVLLEGLSYIRMKKSQLNENSL